jgi:hypothetical protein
MELLTESVSPWKKIFEMSTEAVPFHRLTPAASPLS